MHFGKFLLLLLIAQLFSFLTIIFPPYFFPVFSFSYIFPFLVLYCMSLTCIPVFLFPISLPSSHSFIFIIFLPFISSYIFFSRLSFVFHVPLPFHLLLHSLSFNLLFLIPSLHFTYLFLSHFSLFFPSSFWLHHFCSQFLTSLPSFLFVFLSLIFPHFSSFYPSIPPFSFSISTTYIYKRRESVHYNGPPYTSK
jgi:hypothetical protein